MINICIPILGLHDWHVSSRANPFFPTQGGGGGERDNFVCREGEGLRALFSVIREFNIQ